MTLFSMLLGLLFMAMTVGVVSSSTETIEVSAEKSISFYTQSVVDPSWQELLDAQAIPVGRNSKQGVKGATILVDRDLVEQGPYADHLVPEAIRIHTLGNSFVQRSEFPKWSRWYQEDGNTQVFRLFKGEHNVRNARANAARIEAFSKHKWKHGDGWQTWEGRYTLVAPEGALFQVKAPGPVDWALMISAVDQNRIKLKCRQGAEKIVLTGQQFDLRVRDNGLDYEVYVNDKLEISGNYDRKGLATTFRWGMYVGGKQLVTKDAMVMVTGATITPAKTNK